MSKFPNKLIVIGASAGGISALISIFKVLPKNLQATIMVATHRPKQSGKGLRDLLRHKTDLCVEEPFQGEELECATVYVSPPSESMTVDGANQIHSVPVFNFREKLKTIDDLFISVAEEAKDNTVGVILSGMLSDGIKGLAAIKRAGGIALVQDPEDAKFSSMPENALSQVSVDFVGDPSEIGRYIVDVCTGQKCE